MLDRKIEYLKMSEVEGSLWWYRALHTLITDSLEEYGDGKTSQILDAGCGTGGLLMHLHDEGYLDIAGFDLSKDAVAICQQRGLDVIKGDIRNVDLMYDQNTFDVIISNDTLYFFDDVGRKEILEKFTKLLRPGGVLLLNVPALKAFSGMHDIGVGIKRRFNRPNVRALIESKSLSIQKEIYWPFLVSPLIYIARNFQRLKLKMNPGIQIKSDVELPSKWVNYLLKKVTLLENKIFPSKPFGSSLFVVAEKR